MNTWDFLKNGDTIDIIAPSSAPSDPNITISKINQYFDKFSTLNINIPHDLIQPTPILDEANTVKNRVNAIIKAILNPESKAMWAIIGGGWGIELLDSLYAEIKKLKITKIKPIIGYSDVTAMHIMFNQILNWPSLHGIELGANGDIEPAWNKSKISPILDILMGKQTYVEYLVDILNPNKFPNDNIFFSRILGGNSILVNTLNGTNYGLDVSNKILFIESVARGPGEMSRFLNAIRYSELKKAKAILLGNFIKHGGTPNPKEIEKGFDLIRKFLVDHINIPVFHTTQFGHGPINNTLPLNTYTQCELVNKTQVKIKVSANKMDNF